MVGSDLKHLASRSLNKAKSAAGRPGDPFTRFHKPRERQYFPTDTPPLRCIAIGGNLRQSTAGLLLQAVDLDRDDVLHFGKFHGSTSFDVVF